MEEQIARGVDVGVDLPEADVGRYYQHGWQSWSDTRWVDLGAPRLTNPVHERWGRTLRPWSSTR